MREIRIVALIMAMGVGLSNLVATPAPCQAKSDNRGGVLYLALAPELKYDPYGKYCGMSGTPLPAQAITEGKVGSAPQVAFVIASWPDSARPELGAVAFGLRYPRGIEVIRWGSCGKSMTAPTNSFPLSGEGMALGIAGGDVDTSRTIEIAWLVITASKPGRLELVPHPDPRFASHFATSSDAVETPISELGSLGFGQAGDAPTPQWPGPVVGAACVYDSLCVRITKKEADYYPNSLWFGEQVFCTPNMCKKDAPTGACCLPTGSCAIMNQKSCVGQGGSYQGDGATCTPNPCKPGAAGGAEGSK
jgi:hypothetical protein